ncbi:MAG: GNAT family N-acetyltransferase [Ferruginibacter sp.]
MLEINFSPFPVLQSERLLLRCIRPEDAGQLFVLRSDQKIMQFLDREPFKSIEETTEFIQQKVLNSLESNDGILWVIELQSDPGKLIGTTGFWRLDKAHYRAEIGYMLHSDHWQKGIMKEAVSMSIDWAFAKTEIHSIEANINPGNEASAALLKSVGFEQEAYFKENYYFNGVFKDSIIFSLVKGIHR